MGRFGNCYEQRTGHMARKGRVDRGLIWKLNADGVKVWAVRLMHNGNDERFWSFKTKTEARAFYENAKQEQRLGRFFPERYQRGGYDLFPEYVQRYMNTIGIKKPSTIRAERHFAGWWAEYFSGQRLNSVTPAALDEARQKLVSQGLTQA